jgi:hypothetical protein
MPPEKTPQPQDQQMLEPILEANLMQVQETNKLLEALITLNQNSDPMTALEAILTTLKQMEEGHLHEEVEEKMDGNIKHDEIKTLQLAVIHLLSKIEAKEIVIPPAQSVDMTVTNHMLASLLQEMQKPCEITLTLELE